MSLIFIWAKHVWIEVLIILHRMSKFILSESVIDQQYRTIYKFFIMSDHFRKQVSESIRSTVHQFHCRGGSIFLDGGVLRLTDDFLIGLSGAGLVKLAWLADLSTLPPIHYLISSPFGDGTQST